MSYHHGDLRRALLDAAIGVLSDPNRPILSLRELARTVGVTSGAPYHHFNDLTHLLATIAGEGFRLLLLDLRRVHPGRRVFPGLIRTYLRFGRNHPGYYSAMFKPEVTSPDTIELVKPHADQCFGILMDAIARTAPVSIAEGRRRSAAVWSLLHGIVTLGGNGPLALHIPAKKEEQFAIKSCGDLIAKR